jgi:dimethylhistidine N-methyltransferase
MSSAFAPSALARAAFEPDETQDGGFASDMLEGLRARPRSVPPKYFYDAAGSKLFDRICALEEYYPTRTETALLARHAEAIADCIGPDAELVEFGAGSLRKVRLLLAALRAPRRYVPIDISAEHLQAEATALRAEYPALEVAPLAADFTRGVRLPAGKGTEAARRVGFFPGSSIGNFTPQEAGRFLQAAARLLQGGGLLIGVDLVKDPAVLHRAYNDAQGVTAAFNKNLLVRANRELGASFVLDAFDHYAFYNPAERRIEMHLVSRRGQAVRVAGEFFEFAPGESLHTENSYKYGIESFRSLARSAGFVPGPVWCDDAGLFSVHWLAAPRRAAPKGVKA